MKTKGYMLFDALVLVIITTIISFEIFSLNEIHQSYEHAYVIHQEHNERINEDYY